MSANNFDIESYKNQVFAFPNISFDEFQAIDDMAVRKDIAKKNKVMSTDTYNRTMTFLKWEKGSKVETYTLTFRKSPNKSYNIVYGVRNAVKKILGMPITQVELDFAEEFYARERERWWNAYFNRAMWQRVIDENNWFLPLEIKAVDDWEVLKPNEPVMSITWPGELAAVFEPLFLRVFFQSVAATDMHFIEQIIGEGRVVEFGKRAAVNEDAHIDAVEACFIWGGLKWTSNDLAALAIPQVVSAGTTAHRYFASYSTEDEAFVNAIEKTDRIGLLVDLVDSYRWIDKIVALKKKYRRSGKIISMRLDSWDLVDQVLYGLNKLKVEWMLDPAKDKIVVADISNVDKIREIEEKVREAGFEPKDFILYGLWGLLVARNKLRDTVSAAFKLTQTEDGPTGKLSNDVGKNVIPGKLNIELVDGERVIVQDDEEVRWERLLRKVYDRWQLLFEWSDSEAISTARQRVKDRFGLVELPSRLSKRCEAVRDEVRERFLAVA